MKYIVFFISIVSIFTAKLKGDVGASAKCDCDVENEAPCKGTDEKLRCTTGLICTPINTYSSLKFCILLFFLKTRQYCEFSTLCPIVFSKKD